jgi:hypothetical protein
MEGYIGNSPLRVKGKPGTPWDFSWGLAAATTLVCLSGAAASLELLSHTLVDRIPAGRFWHIDSAGPVHGDGILSIPSSRFLTPVHSREVTQNRTE